MLRSHRRALRPVLDLLDDRYLLSGLSPQQVTQAYGLNAVSFSANGQTIKGDGTGQTIAIVVAYHDAYLASDLKTFDAAYHLADPTLNQINLAGASSDNGWAGEETLDVEWAHAIAPGANIVVVEASSENFFDMMHAVDAARQVPGVSVVSLSWGMSESPTQLAYDNLFTTPAGHTGVTFVAASGDSGPFAGTEWPASSPNVVSVGGTTLFVDASGNYAGESTWGGSGGGYSQFEPEPSYQQGVQGTGVRTSPDLAFDANPSTGVSVFTTNPSNGTSSWNTVGGTSLAAPAWAAIVAIADQGRALQGKSSLDGATQTLPQLYSLPASDFHRSSTGLISTGLGTPSSASLVTDLAGATTTSSSPTTTTQGTGQTVLATTTTGTQTGTTRHHPRGWHGRGARWWTRARIGRANQAETPTSSRTLL